MITGKTDGFYITGAGLYECPVIVIIRIYD